MKRESEVRALLINNAIRLIAEGGFEKATTKELAYSGGSLPDLKMNEAYIYRLFGSKENLYEAAFIALDSELFHALREGLAKSSDFSVNTRENMYEFFLRAWVFVLKNEERCRCYVRYYYSIYFKGTAQEVHRRRFEGLTAEWRPLFREDADVFAIMHSVIIMLLDFAIRVYNGELENSEENIPHIFNVLYCMMVTYFRNPSSVA